MRTWLGVWSARMSVEGMGMEEGNVGGKGGWVRKGSRAWVEREVAVVEFEVVEKRV